MSEESVYYHGCREDKSVTYGGPTYSTIEEAKRARDYYNKTYKSSDKYGFFAWIVGINILDKFDEEEFDKYME